MKIPRIDQSTARLASETGTQRVEPAMIAKPTQELGNLAQTAGAVAQKFEDLTIQNEKNEQTLVLNKGFSEIQTRAMNDPDIDKPEIQAKYKQEADTFYKSAVDKISLPYARAEFNAQSGVQAIQVNTEIAKYGLKKSIVKGIATSNEIIDGFGNHYATANKDGRENLLKLGDAKIDEGTRLGLWAEDKAYEKKKALREDWTEKAINTLIAEDANEAENQIVSGAFPEISADKKANYLKIIESARASQERKAERKLKAAQVENGTNLGTALLRGEADIVDVIEKTNSKEITPEMAQQAYEYLTWESGQEYMKTDEDSWNYVMENALDPKVDMEKFFGILMEAKLTKKDADMFLSWAKDGYDYMENYKPKDPKWEYFDTVRNSMKEFSKSLYDPTKAPKALYDMTKVLFEQINKGNIPEEKIISRGKELMGQAVLKTIKGTENLPSSGGIFVDKNGNRVKIYPNGEIEEIQ